MENLLADTLNPGFVERLFSRICALYGEILARTTRVSNAIGFDCPVENVAAGSKRRAITTQKRR